MPVRRTRKKAERDRSKKNRMAIKEAIKNGVMKVVPIDSVKQWNKNPRKNDKAVPALQKILKKHGQVTPIVVYTGDNMIRKGNTTHKAMKANGAKEILALFVDFDSAAVANAYGVADNISSEWADWDSNLLADLMRDEIAPAFSEDELPDITGLKSKAIKSFLMSDELPDELPAVNLQGGIDGKSDFVVLQFKSGKEMAEFKNRLGIDSENSRVVAFDVLLGKMQWKTPAGESVGSRKRTKIRSKK